MTAHIPHLHAESMMLYAEDAAKTAKPWELWEFISFGMEDWQPLDSNPNWGFATDYRRKIKMADPQAGADALDAELVAAVVYASTEAMNSSMESPSFDGSIILESHHAASLSLALDELQQHRPRSRQQRRNHERDVFVLPKHGLRSLPWQSRR